MTYLVLSVHDYKGGELGHPETYGSVEELLCFWDGTESEKLYDLASDGKKQEFIASLKEEVKETLESIYAGFSGSAYAIYTIDEEFNFNTVDSDDIVYNTDFDKVWELVLKEWI